MTGSYDAWLVALSILVACMASYVALDLASRVAAAAGRRAARYWLVGGALSMGTGIWSMHFIGMLAFRLPIPMSYDVPTTLASLAIAVLVSGYALRTVSSGALGVRRLLGAGLLMGAGIAAMHYTGMAAMQLRPPLQYQPALFALSVAIAVAASVVALWIAFRLRRDTMLSAFWRRSGSALVMGLAIAGMHYTGMGAALFAPDSICSVPAQDIDNVWLAVAIAAFCLAFFGTTLLISVFDERLAARSARHAERLRESEETYRTLLEATSDAVLLVDDAGRIEFANAAVERVFGYAPGELVGQNTAMLRPESMRGERARLLARYVETGQKTVDWRSTEILALHRDGTEFPTEMSFDRVHLRGEPRFAVFVRDITRRKHAEAQLEHLAQFDAVTGLPNRNLLRDRLGQALTRAQRGNWMTALMFVDLDRFKEINDTLGHGFGDSVLKTAGQRLRACLRKADTVARFGGDEFTLIVEDAGTVEQVEAVGRKLLHALETPIEIDGKELFITGSIGIAVYPEHGQDADSLLKNADAAMYHAKSEGRNNLQFFLPQMGAAALRRTGMTASLRQGLARGEFLLHYQPIVDLRSGAIVGAEALLRWQHPEWGLTAPGEFIQVAEQSGLIVPIGEWVLREACAQAAEWRDAGLPQLQVSVNVSVRQFRKADLVEVVTAVLAQTGLPPGQLKLELTESLLMDKPEASGEVLARLKAMGVCIALDDFGTGYSSLSYLKHFPLDTIKIDRAFVRDLTRDADDAAIVKAMIALAHSLQLSLTAEGVETTAQLAFLREQGCETGQGYLFSRPVLPAHLRALLRSGLAPEFNPAAPDKLPSPAAG